jgi:hypothetical protein
VHKISVPNKNAIRNPDSLPDIKDPDFCCRACEKTLSNKSSYMAHLLCIHNINVPATPRKLIINHNITADIKDPNFHCAACETTYSVKSFYVAHLKSVRRMKFSLVQKGRTTRNPHIIPDENDANSYCSACEKSFTIYKMMFTTCNGRNQIIHPELTPDINDPNIFCCACDKSFVRKQKYHVRLKEIHKINLTAPLPTIKNPNKTPDVIHSNHYCTACERKFRYKHRYRYHLRRIRKTDISIEDFFKMIKIRLLVLQLTISSVRTLHFTIFFSSISNKPK